ncbi:hypothetical protein SPRG_07252 [Saprolegnia parasitica CBS 223.65]|uniref:PH domain-containing protein n=1 Tax=Saprolegnia parasitica (strain CBS 223.65) TaxID=695850 RepID=A0A067CFL6_SAPPC|nr:hypothetical protein SPRG_07252 [Saprolegnia parasitica CBS 223.65]KDO27975.1 hypothetical protein SPRG_07252 [Saprolegnia parasitica CBS 223.65]|eukprot:XP_012201424.1 hypothetical protein SPRG_07252 [Saprolegnia parasitica CBS 223.65]
MMCEEATARPSVGFGLLWKFPSEGSNSADAGGSFPRRCDCCGDAWVTSLDDFERHAETCRGTRRPRRLELGAPRQYWCEIAASSLEWREAAHALQDEHNQVPFTTVVRVAPLDDDCFQVVTLQSCVTFRAESHDERNAWISALGEAIFCLGAPPGAEVTEAIGACLRRGGDVDELEAIVQSHPAAITNTDIDGNSVLLVACKMGAPFDVFRLLLHYGADAYAANAK